MTWVYSSLLALHQKQRRLERLRAAQEELEELDRKLQGPRPRKRSRRQIGERVDELLSRHHVSSYLAVDVWQEELHRFRQEHHGRPGKDTRYRRETKRRWRVRWERATRFVEKALATADVDLKNALEASFIEDLALGGYSTDTSHSMGTP